MAHGCYLDTVDTVLFSPVPSIMFLHPGPAGHPSWWGSRISFCGGPSYVWRGDAQHRCCWHSCWRLGILHPAEQEPRVPCQGTAMYACSCQGTAMYACLQGRHSSWHRSLRSSWHDIPFPHRCMISFPHRCMISPTLPSFPPSRIVERPYLRSPLPHRRMTCQPYICVSPRLIVTCHVASPCVT